MFDLNSDKESEIANEVTTNKDSENKCELNNHKNVRCTKSSRVVKMLSHLRDFVEY